MKKLILSLIFFSSIAYAEHNKDVVFWWQNLPAVCGSVEDVEVYINENDFVAKSASLGRQGSQPDGEPVYMVTIYENDRQEILSTVDIPDRSERCMIFHTFNKVTTIEK